MPLSNEREGRKKRERNGGREGGIMGMELRKVGSFLCSFEEKPPKSAETQPALAPCQLLFAPESMRPG